MKVALNFLTTSESATGDSTTVPSLCKRTFCACLVESTSLGFAVSLALRRVVQADTGVRDLRLLGRARMTGVCNRIQSLFTSTTLTRDNGAGLAGEAATSVTVLSTVTVVSATGEAALGKRTEPEKFSSDAIKSVRQSSLGSLDIAGQDECGGESMISAVGGTRPAEAAAPLQQAR